MRRVRAPAPAGLDVQWLSLAALYRVGADGKRAYLSRCRRREPIRESIDSCFGSHTFP